MMTCGVQILKREDDEDDGAAQGSVSSLRPKRVGSGSQSVV